MYATTQKQENRYLTESDLHRYQIAIRDRIIKQKKVAVWVDMGLGKTAATATAMDKLLDAGKVKRVLVIAPPRVAAETWPTEFVKWEHLKKRRCVVLTGTPAKRKKLISQGADFFCISNALVPWLVGEYKDNWPFDTIIIDEASAFKSAKSKRFKALKKVIGETKRVVQLTGTPTSNGLLDLWPQMYLLDGGQRLGRTMFAYKSRFFTSDYMGYTWTPREGAEQLIHARLDDLCFSLTGEDYLSLPDKIINDVFVSLPNDAKKTYEQLEKDFILRLEESNIIASSAAVLTNKLGQCANGFIYDDTGTAKDIHNEKIKALQEIVDGANGAPVLVAYTYREDLNRILKEFDFAEALTPSSVPRWNAGDIPMLIVHPASAGHGLNLQAGGNICIWYGLPWSLELYQQFNARLHRQGQTKPVFIHRIITKNTVDESIIMGLDNKHVTQKQLIESLKLDIQKRVD